MPQKVAVTPLCVASAWACRVACLAARTALQNSKERSSATVLQSTSYTKLKAVYEPHSSPQPLIRSYSCRHPISLSTPPPLARFETTRPEPHGTDMNPSTLKKPSQPELASTQDAPKKALRPQHPCLCHMPAPVRRFRAGSLPLPHATLSDGRRAGTPPELSPGTAASARTKIATSPAATPTPCRRPPRACLPPQDRAGSSCHPCKRAAAA